MHIYRAFALFCPRGPPRRTEFPPLNMSSTATASAVLINGRWRDAHAEGTFTATNPNTNTSLETPFPVSHWNDIDEALDAAVDAFTEMRKLDRETIANFLDAYADLIDGDKDSLAEIAHTETGLPVSPRLADVEIPRTSNQLRLAAAACRDGSWSMPTIDTATNIRSCYRGLGPVAVFGPNNFPFAFNSVAGGDFAAAIAAGNPVIGKANSSHPETTRRLAELALKAAEKTGVPPAIVQLVYRTSHADGERLVSDPRIGATGYTGARGPGLVLKSAADRAGKPIYLELSSVNPVVVTAAALRERSDDIADQYMTSVLMGAGQFCTNPGVILVPSGDDGDSFVKTLGERFAATAPGTLLSPGVQKSLGESIEHLKSIGASVVSSGDADADRCTVANTLLSVDGDAFLNDPEGFQTEAFGNAALVVRTYGVDQACQIIRHLEGNLTGSIYSHSGGDDDADAQRIAFELEPKVGRLLNDKMPTGVAVSPAMNHGGPYPSTGHPGFTAVGVPGSLIRFAKLTSFDNVRPGRLPKILRDKNLSPQTFRRIDDRVTNEDIG